jgi:hypothetical protein
VGRAADSIAILSRASRDEFRQRPVNKKPHAVSGAMKPGCLVAPLSVNIHEVFGYGLARITWAPDPTLDAVHRQLPATERNLDDCTVIELAAP